MNLQDFNNKSLQLYLVWIATKTEETNWQLSKWMLRLTNCQFWNKSLNYPNFKLYFWQQIVEIHSKLNYYIYWQLLKSIFNTVKYLVSCAFSLQNIRELSVNPIFFLAKVLSSIERDFLMKASNRREIKGRVKDSRYRVLIK